MKEVSSAFGVSAKCKCIRNLVMLKKFYSVSLIVMIFSFSSAGCKAPTSGFTKENYQKVKKGMSLAEVESLLGPCTNRLPQETVKVMTEAGLVEQKRDILIWIGDGGWEFKAEFIGGKLFAAPIPYDTKITLENYRKLKRGATLKDCELILGPATETPLPPYELTIDGVTYRRSFRRWTIPDHGSIDLVFDDDKLIIKDTTIPEIREKLTEADAIH